MDQTFEQFVKDKRAIVVEDEAAIGQLLKINLMQLGFQVEVFQNAESALSAFASKNYALCLLDWMLPQQQGIDFLKLNRHLSPATKVMMLTAKSDSDSIVKGLDSGADDYMTKPFEAKVLAARIRQLMRRLQLENNLMALANNENQKVGLSEAIDFDGLYLDVDKHIVKINKQDIHLTTSEFKLLSELIKAKGKVLTRDRLIDLIQGSDVSVTGRTIDTHVFALRKKIGNWSRHIETIRGVGYRVLLSVEDQTEPELT